MVTYHNKVKYQDIGFKSHTSNYYRQKTYIQTYRWRRRQISLNREGITDFKPGTSGYTLSLLFQLPDKSFFQQDNSVTTVAYKWRSYLMFFNFFTLGFTSLCERYSMSAVNGTDQLSRTLNGYMGAIVDCIFASDGDVLKFAGKLSNILIMIPVNHRSRYC